MTYTIASMLETHPTKMDVDAQILAECVEACVDCAQSCTACADACLAEESLAELTTCILLNNDCADICDATGRILSRQSAADPEFVRSLLEACARACGACATECERHEHMEHCLVCAEACRRCERACRDMMGALTA